MKHLSRFDEALSERLITENQIFHEAQLIREDRIIIICDNNIVISNIFTYIFYMFYITCFHYQSSLM